MKKSQVKDKNEVDIISILNKKLQQANLMKNSSLETWVKTNKRESRESYLIYRDRVLFLEDLLVNLTPFFNENQPN